MGASSLILYVGTVANAAFMVVVAVLTFVFQSYRWWYPAEDPRVDERSGDAVPGRGLLLVPARHEESVLGATLERLAELDYPSFVVGVIVDHPDDPGTLAVARDAQARHPGLIHIVRYPEDTDVHNKPIGLNTALRELDAAGLDDWAWVGVVDAEDLLHVDLLRLIDHRFRVSGAAIVQAGVQLVNAGSAHRHLPLPESRSLTRWSEQHPGRPAPWLTRMGATVSTRGRRWLGANLSTWWRAANCLEYYKWFRSRLGLQAQIGVIPLGGNTVFFRREFAEAVRARDAAEGGSGDLWDESCLTEDCKIGMMASAMGFRVDVVYVPEMATREETPQTLVKFVRQRVRWMQGFIQVFSDGQWRELPTRRQRLLAVYILGFQFFQAYTGIVAPAVFVAGFFFKVPVVIVLVATIPLGILVLGTLIDLVMLHEFGRLFEVHIRIRDYAAIIYGAVLFQLALAVAAVWAIVRHVRGHTNWVKTAHTGAHLHAPDLGAPALSAALADGGAR